MFQSTLVPTLEVRGTKRCADTDPYFTEINSHRAMCENRNGAVSQQIPVSQFCTEFDDGNLFNYTRNRVTAWPEGRKKEYMTALLCGQANIQMFVRKKQDTPILEVGDGNNRMVAITDFVSDKFPITVSLPDSRKTKKDVYCSQLPENVFKRLMRIPMLLVTCMGVDDASFDLMINRMNQGTIMTRGEHMYLQVQLNTPRCKFVKLVANQCPWVETELRKEGRGIDLVCQMFMHLAGPSNRRALGDPEFRDKIQCSRYAVKYAKSIATFLEEPTAFSAASNEGKQLLAMFEDLTLVFKMAANYKMTQSEQTSGDDTVSEFHAKRIPYRQMNQRFTHATLGLMLAYLHDKVPITRVTFELAYYAVDLMVKDKVLSESLNHLQQQKWIGVTEEQFHKTTQWQRAGRAGHYCNEKLMNELKQRPGNLKNGMTRERMFSPSDVVKFDLQNATPDCYMTLTLPEGEGVWYYTIHGIQDDYDNKTRELLRMAVFESKSPLKEQYEKYNDLYSGGATPTIDLPVPNPGPARKKARVTAPDAGEGSNILTYFHGPDSDGEEPPQPEVDIGAEEGEEEEH